MSEIPPWTHRPVRVGLVGAGPWARAAHAPMLAAGPETELAAVWARRPEAAEETAAPYGVPVAAGFEDLLDRCEAVAFAVPPDVQAALAVRAARAGKALLLEKPLGLDLASARRLADAAGDAGVVSQVVLTNRFHPGTRRFLREARAAAQAGAVVGARACMLGGAFLGGPFATPWRLEHGALLDLGPHLLDLLDAAVGPVATVRGTGDPRRWIELTCEHENGVVSQASLSGSVHLPQGRSRVELFGTGPELVLDTTGFDFAACAPLLRAEFARAVRTGSASGTDVRRGLRLQELLSQAA